MVPPASHGVSRVPRYSGFCSLTCLFAYTAFTFFGMTSHSFLLRLINAKCSPQPRRINPPVWPLPRSLATTCGISVDFFSSPYLDVSVREVPHVYLCIQYTLRKLYLRGLLHSDISGSMRTYRSPKLFAVNHVLHRLPMPRHSPCALFSLTNRKQTFACSRCELCRPHRFLKL